MATDRRASVREDEKQLQKLSTTMDFIQKDIGEIKSDVKDIKTNYVTQAEFKVLVDSLKGYVTHSDFAPIKALVYGATGLILIGVMGALISLVIKN